MHIAIIGSRDYPNLQEVVDFVNSLPLDVVIVTGCARGVDATAYYTAELRVKAGGQKPIKLKADWSKYGKSAGHIRNAEIENISDQVVAFWDLKSPGTRDCIELFRKNKKPVEIRFPNT